MPKPLRKTLEFALFGELVPVDVDWRVIEVIERTFNTSADALIGHFVTMERVQRRHVADVLCDLLARKGDLAWKRGEIREHVMTADAADFYQWVAQINTALLYALKHMTDEEFDRVKGELEKTRAKMAAADAAAASGADDQGDEKKRPDSTDSPTGPTT